MANATQNAILTANINGTLKDLMIKTTANQVMVDGTTTLTAKLSQMPTNGSMNTAISSAIENKADKSVVESLQTTVSATKNTVDGLGTLATKNTVTESCLDAALKEKVNTAAKGNHSHSNKSVLDGISSANVAAWNGKGTVYASKTQPANLAAGDLWLQLTD